jgi:V/A-type H+-transporting ATPase subunit C
MDRMDFLQAVARTRVFETRLLTRARIERMVDARDIEEVFRILGETEYANVMPGSLRGEDYEKILYAELKRVYKLMEELSAEKIVVDLMALKYDYHNLKTLVKSKALNKDLDELYIPLGTQDFQQIKTAYLAGDLKDVDPKFREALEAATNDFELKGDPQRIDLILDKYYFQHLYELAKETDIPLFVNYVQDLIDFSNIKTLIRLKKQNKDLRFVEEALLSHGKINKEEIALLLTDSLDSIINKLRNYEIGPATKKGLEAYQRTGRLSDFEKEMDNYLMGLNKPSQYIHFGPEPIFSYLVAKETEIKVLRIIMVSKLNKLSPDAIRGRLRDLYV